MRDAPRHVAPGDNGRATATQSCGSKQHRQAAVQGVAPTSLAFDKRLWRAAMRRQRDTVSRTAQLTCGLALSQRLQELARSWEPAMLVGSLPHRGEASAEAFVAEWLATGRPLLLPRTPPDGTGDLELRAVSSLELVRAGYRGCPEPDASYCPLARPEGRLMVLVPGLAFAADGRRLGQGGGHYDRLLEALRRAQPGGVLAVGLAYDWQVQRSVPFDPAWDQRVDAVATPRCWWRCKD